MANLCMETFFVLLFSWLVMFSSTAYHCHLCSLCRFARADGAQHGRRKWVQSRILSHFTNITTTAAKREEKRVRIWITNETKMLFNRVDNWSLEHLLRGSKMNWMARSRPHPTTEQHSDDSSPCDNIKLPVEQHRCVWGKEREFEIEISDHGILSLIVMTGYKFNWTIAKRKEWWRCEGRKGRHREEKWECAGERTANNIIQSSTIDR